MKQQKAPVDSDTLSKTVNVEKMDFVKLTYAQHVQKAALNKY